LGQGNLSVTYNFTFWTPFCLEISPFCLIQNSVPLTMEVAEEIPVGIRIGEVAAVDQDVGINAEIDYAIIRK
jgi:hypothetical protein